jgi:hypothetical protein
MVPIKESTDITKIKIISSVNDTYINDGRFSTYHRQRKYDVILDSADMHEHLHGFTGNYRDIKLEDYRGNRNDTV